VDDAPGDEPKPLSVRLFHRQADPGEILAEVTGIIVVQIVQAAGCLLFAKTDPPSFLLMRQNTRWDLPKGHAEPGEELLQTALRETEEETGIPAHQIRIDADFRYTFEYDVCGRKRGDYRKRVTYFLGFISEPVDVVLSEHTGFRWIPWPVHGSIQTQTVDPLLRAAQAHFDRFPERLAAQS
jgi:bis(5'-nucleosidyl)-tetraphosphatase